MGQPDGMEALGLEPMERALLPVLLILLWMKPTSCGGDASPRRDGQTIAAGNLQAKRVRVRRTATYLLEKVNTAQ